jgi:nitroreductase
MRKNDPFIASDQVYQNETGTVMTLSKPAHTAYPLHGPLRQRWSPRAFSPQPLDPDTISTLFEAARWSPSSQNLQPWRFLAVTSAQAEAHAALVNILNRNNQRWAVNAPLLIVAVARIMTSSEPPSVNRFAWYDVGQAVAHLTIQASSMGLVSHQMGGFSPDQARTLFSIPDGYEPVVVIAVGYQAAPETLPDDLREREHQPRSRRPLPEMVFGTTWDEPALILPTP